MHHPPDQKFAGAPRRQNMNQLSDSFSVISFLTRAGTMFDLSSMLSFTGMRLRLRPFVDFAPFEPRDLRFVHWLLGNRYLAQILNRMLA